jgi:hypothetical protein
MIRRTACCNSARAGLWGARGGNRPGLPGEKDFSGEEIVYLGDTPIWGMNYYGKMLRDDVPEGFIETLREALLKIRKEEPYRGCRYYARDRYEYFCTTEGVIGFFHGCETVEYEKKEVYRLYFHGGQVR